MNHRLYFLLGLLFCLSHWLKAQSSQKPWSFGFHAGAYSYDALREGFFRPQNYGQGLQFSLYKALNDKGLDLGLETGFAQVRHPLDPDALNPTERDNWLGSQIMARYRFDNGKTLKKDFILTPFIKGGLGGLGYGNLSRWGLYIPAGAGLMVRPPNTALNFILQTSINYDFAADALFVQHHLGLALNFGQNKRKRGPATPRELSDEGQAKAPDRDYDGVPDEIDQCPDIFGSALTMGCPDRDKDGVRDSEDECPDTPGFANLQGCLDSDYDGVIDPRDKCPDVYGEGPDGCPLSNVLDRDGDGIPDDQDKCPDVAGLFTAKGCPDADADGIPDDKDECPELYGLAEYGGCPLPKQELERLREAYERELQRERQQNQGKDPNAPIDFAAYSDPRSPQYNPYYSPHSDPDNPEYNPKHPRYNPELDPYHPKYKAEHPGNEYAKRQANNSNGLADNNNRGGGNRGGGNNNTGGGNPADPSGLGRGGIFIGNPQSDKFGGITLTGFTPVQQLSPEDQAYCQRLDLSALRSAIYFDYNDAQIGGQSIRALDKVVEAMRRCAMLELQIAGHTDSDGSPVKNMGLSEKRAKAVMRYLTGQGINDRRLKFNAYGEQYPIAPNTNPENKQQNRRAEIRIQRAY